MTYRHSLVFAAACLGMLLFGVTLTTLGSVLALAHEPPSVWTAPTPGRSCR